MRNIPQTERRFLSASATVNQDARTVELSFSSTEPCDRWWGREVLDHSPRAVDMSRLVEGCPLLLQHDQARQIGVVQRAWLDDEKGRAVVRFSRAPDADAIFQDVADGIRSNVSVGYQILETQNAESDGEPVVLVTRWRPYEISIVSVGFDATVGVGRQLDRSNNMDTNTNGQHDDQGAHLSRGQSRALAKSREEEAARMREIRALAKRFGLESEGDQAIEEGTPVDEFKELVMRKMPRCGTLRPAERTEIGMTRNDIGRYSILRAINALMDDSPTGEARRKAGFEIECSRAYQAAIGRESDGITIPPDVLDADDFLPSRARRDLTVGTFAGGGALVPTTVDGSRFIDMLRAQSVIFDLGVTILRDLTGNVSIPRQTGTAAAYWVAENVGLTEGQMTVDQLQLTPKTCGAYTDFSRRLALQTSGDAERLVRRDLTALLSAELERVTFNGSGSGTQPAGIMNTSGIGAVQGGANGAAPTWDMLVDLQAAIMNANVSPDSSAWAMNPKTRAKLLKTQQFAGTSGDNVYQAALAIGKIIVSTYLPSDLTKGTSVGVCSAIIYGDFSNVVIGMWGGLDLMLDPYTGGTAGTKRLIAFMDVDIGLRQAAAFAAMKDALTT